MSGVAPPVYIITEPFGASAAVPADATLPIPVPSQVGVLVGAASFEDGFPPATRTDPEAGGVPPFGQDMNGILYMVSAYCAYMQAGGVIHFDAAAAAEFGGYAVGAVVQSTLNPNQLFTNVLDGNTNDPDTVGTGWVSSVPLYSLTVATAGAHNNVALPGPSDYVLDFDTTAGNADYSGFVAQRDGQRLYISNTGANLLTLQALNGGSTAPRQIRIPGDLALVQNQTATIQYSSALSRWLLV